MPLWGLEVVEDPLELESSIGEKREVRMSISTVISILNVHFKVYKYLYNVSPFFLHVL